MTTVPDEHALLRTPNTDRAPSLGNAAAVDLVSAWISHRARSLGIRVLVIKGPLAGRLGLREQRASADADVLVEPGRLDDLVVHVAAFGWYERPVSTAPRIVESHSVSMIHGGWPVDIDLHAFWPGFLGDADAVFESLWSERLDLALANVPVAAPDIEAAILILALHSLRRPLGRDRHRVDTLENLRTAALQVVGEPVAEKLLRRADELGAVQTAAPFLRLFGVRITPDPHPGEALTLWHLKAQTNGNVGAWMLEFRKARGIPRLRIVQRAVLPGPAELRAQHPELPRGPHGVVLGWITRWRTGAREIPRTLASVRRLRTRKRQATG